MGEDQGSIPLICFTNLFSTETLSSSFIRLNQRASASLIEAPISVFREVSAALLKLSGGQPRVHINQHAAVHDLRSSATTDHGGGNGFITSKGKSESVIKFTHEARGAHPGAGSSRP